MLDAVPGAAGDPPSPRRPPLRALLVAGVRRPGENAHLRGSASRGAVALRPRVFQRSLRPRERPGAERRGEIRSENRSNRERVVGAGLGVLGGRLAARNCASPAVERNEGRPRSTRRARVFLRDSAEKRKGRDERERGERTREQLKGTSADRFTPLSRSSPLFALDCTCRT